MRVIVITGPHSGSLKDPWSAMLKDSVQLISQRCLQHEHLDGSPLSPQAAAPVNSLHCATGRIDYTPTHTSALVSENGFSQFGFLAGHLSTFCFMIYHDYPSLFLELKRKLYELLAPSDHHDGVQLGGMDRHS